MLEHFEKIANENQKKSSVSYPQDIPESSVWAAAIDEMRSIFIKKKEFIRTRTRIYEFKDKKKEYSISKTEVMECNSVSCFEKSRQCVFNNENKISVGKLFEQLNKELNSEKEKRCKTIKNSSHRGLQGQSKDQLVEGAKKLQSENDSLKHSNTEQQVTNILDRLNPQIKSFLF